MGKAKSLNGKDLMLCPQEANVQRQIADKMIHLLIPPADSSMLH